MSREKRAMLLKAMSVILEAVSDEDVHDTFEGSVPADYDLEENLDYYLSDRIFAGTMDAFLRLAGQAIDTGLWCDGISSEDEISPSPEKLVIRSARKIPIRPNQVIFSGETNWLISGTFKGMPFLANSQGTVHTETVLEGDDLFDPNKKFGRPFAATEERKLLRMLAEKLKNGTVDDLTLEEAEIMEANWKGNDWKGKEW